MKECKMTGAGKWQKITELEIMDNVTPEYGCPWKL